MIAFAYSHLIGGGAETLIMRLARNFRKHNHDSKVFCLFASASVKRQYSNNYIEIVELKNWESEEIFKTLSDQDYIFTFSLMDFFMCQSYVKRKKINSKVILYLLHPKVLKLERFSKFKYFQGIFKHLLRKNIYQYIDNGNIIFMDEMCIEWTENFYEKEIEEKQKKIFRLPLEDNILCEEENRTPVRSRNEEFQILTISRSDFPFKGYVKGVIHDVIVLSKKYEKLKLKIISFGPDINKLERWVYEAGINDHVDIELLGEVNYDELNQHYYEADLFIGMGTSLLDAAKYGVISLNALMHTYDFKSTGFFHEFPYLLGAEESNCVNGQGLIEKALLFSDEEYIRYSRESRKLFKENYSIDFFIERFLKQPIATPNCFISPLITIGIKYFQKRRRNIKNP